MKYNQIQPKIEIKLDILDKYISHNNANLEEKFNYCKDLTSELFNENELLKSKIQNVKSSLETLYFNVKKIYESMCDIQLNKETEIDWSQFEFELDIIDQLKKNDMSSQNEISKQKFRSMKSFDKKNKDKNIENENNKDLNSKSVTFNQSSKNNVNNSNIVETVTNPNHNNFKIEIPNTGRKETFGRDMENLHLNSDLLGELEKNYIQNQKIAEDSILRDQDVDIDQNQNNSKLNKPNNPMSADLSFGNHNNDFLYKYKSILQNENDYQLKNIIQTQNFDNNFQRQVKNNREYKNNYDYIEQLELIKIQSPRCMIDKTEQSYKSISEADFEVELINDDIAFRNKSNIRADSIFVLDDIEEDNNVNDLRINLIEQPGGAFIFDNNQTILQCNKKLAELLLQSRFELIDKSFLHIIARNNKEDFEKLVTQSMHKILNTSSKGVNDTIIIENEEISTQNMEVYDKENNLNKFELQMKGFLSKENSESRVLFVMQMLPIKFQIEENSDQIIDPRSAICMLWNMALMIILIQLLWQIPQSLIFSDFESNFVLDGIITCVFIVDILINFNLAVENARGEMEFVRSKIINNYIKGWFAIDFISTFPFGLIINSTSNSLFLLKILKITRLARFLKLYKFYNLSQFTDSFWGKDIQQLLKKQQIGLYILRNSLQFMVYSHLYTILLIQLKNENSGDIDNWLSTQYEQELSNHSNMEVYVQMMSNNLKTALGFINPNFVFIQDILLDICWLFVGLSIIGQSLGDISSQLSYLNQENMEFNSSIYQFHELCMLHKIDPRVENSLLNDLREHRLRYDDMKFVKNCNILSKNVAVQLESGLQKEFISQFKLFTKFDIKLLRSIKNACKFSDKELVIRTNSIISNVQLVISGSINIYDKELNLKNQHSTNEIFGFQYFKKQCQNKQHIDFDVIEVEQHNSKIQDIFSKNSSFRLDTRENNRKNSNSSIKRRDSVENISNSVHSCRFVENYEVQIRFQDQAICSENTQQLIIDFEWLEDLLLEDYQSFRTIYQYDKHNSAPITDQEYKESRTVLKRFASHLTPAMIILEDGTIYDINHEFMTKSNSVRLDRLIGMNALPLFFSELERWGKFTSDSVMKNPESVNDLNLGDYEFNSEMIQFKVEVVKIEKHKIVRRDNKQNINKKINKNFQKQRKSMLKAMFIQFEIINV